VIGAATLPAPHQRGTIYYAHDQSTEGVGILRAVNPDGTEKWKYKIGNFVRQSSPAIDKNGIIYVGDLLGFLHAFRDNGSGQCRADLEVQGQQPVAGPDRLARHLRGLDHPLHRDEQRHPRHSHGPHRAQHHQSGLFQQHHRACNPIRWTFATAGRVDQTPALAADGTLYVPAMDGGQKRLYAVNSNGAQKWVFGPISSGSETSAHAIVGAMASSTWASRTESMR
jgi:outer membrane protein assembly factor BamB